MPANAWSAPCATARERQGTGWPEWVSAELCVADDPLFVRKVVARLKAAVDWQRQRAA
ncbi:TPA: hypothetical protein NHO34_005971 [Pseudomonas aeruginosa]|nr:hypothetical protein [Pseudomonas aeruginosa]